MKNSRFILHPLLLNKKSRVIFFYFFCLALFLGLFLNYQFERIIKLSGLDLTYGPPTQGWLLSLLISKYFRGAIILLAAVLSSSLTAQFVVGPVKRIEQWLIDWQAGRTVAPLRVRNKDKFSKLVELMNQLKAKISS